MKISDMTPAAYNPRKIKDDELARLKKSLLEFGDLSGIVYNRRTGNVVGGHQRIKCLPPDATITRKELQEPTRTGTVAQGIVNIDGENYTFREVDWDEQREKAANIAANQHGGQFDDALLAQLLADITKDGTLDTDLVGFSDRDLTKLLNTIIGSEDPREEIDTDGALPGEGAEPITKPGDLYILGTHRLLCGDSTNPEHIKLLMDGNSADMIFTDPPYGVSYADKNKYLNTLNPGKRITTDIENDHATQDDMRKFWKSAFSTCRTAMAPGASYYITGPQGGDLLFFLLLALKESDFILKHMLIWIKNNQVFGRCDYNYKHEPIIFGWVEGAHRFFGPANEVSTWEIDRPLKSELHPTMKPVELVERAIKNSTMYGEIVLDAFLGSGTTIIAAEQTGRRCFGLEISPAYCDVIVARWENLTGQKAERISTAA